MDEDKKVLEDKKALEEKKEKVEDVKVVIEERKEGGPDAIGEAEIDRQRREREGRAARNEHQDVPVALRPLEPSVERLKGYKAGLEQVAEGAELEVAKERQFQEAVAGASLNFLHEEKTDAKPVSKPVEESEGEVVLGGKKKGKKK